MSIQIVCERAASKIAAELNMNEEQKSVIQYGFFAIIQTTIAILINILFGTWLGVLVPSLIISLVAVTLRKYSGGVHAQTPEYCIIIGTFVSVGGALCISRLPWNRLWIILIGGFLFGIAYYVIWKLAPVDSVAKPIRRDEKKKMLKKRSIYILIIDYIIILIMLFLNIGHNHNSLLVYIACMYAGIGWQAFTLTHIGHVFMRKIDLFLNKILKKDKRGVY